MGEAAGCSLSVPAVQGCLPWDTPGLSPKDEAMGTGTPGAGLSQLCLMGCKGTWFGAGGEIAAYASSNNREGKVCVISSMGNEVNKAIINN